MVPKTTELFMEIKRYGFQRTSDDLGTYFTKGEVRMSCMKHGHMYLCYYNKLVGKEWVLQSKSYQPFKLDDALVWIVRLIQSTGLIY